MAHRLKQLQGQFVKQTHSFFNYLDLLPVEDRPIITRVDEWCQQNLTTNEINQCYDKAQFPVHLIPSLQQLDIIKYFLKTRGAQPVDTFTQGMILATIASYDPSVSLFLLLQGPLCGRTLQKLGSQQQQDEHINNLIKLKKVWGWALTEQKIGSHASQIGTNVKKTKQGYILNGNKRWIGNGNGDYLVVYAKNLTNNKINAFIVDMKTEGITRNKIQNKLALRQVQNYQIYFQNVHLPESSFLPEAKSYRKGVEKMLMASRINIIFLTFGVCVGIYRNAIKYASKRQQFGVPISSFQLVQEKLVKIMANVQAISLICWRIATMQSKGESTIGMIGMSKAWVTERARQISRWGREILGGNGITHDNFIMKGLADIEALYTLEGTYEINTLIAGRELTGMAAFKSQKSPYSD